MIKTNKILDKCNDIIDQTDKNHTVEKEEFEHHQKELEKFATPSLSSCTTVQEVCQEDCLEAPLVVEPLHLLVPPGPTTEELD